MELHEWLQQLKDKVMQHLELLMQRGDIKGPPKADDSQQKKATNGTVTTDKREGTPLPAPAPKRQKVPLSPFRRSFDSSPLQC